MSSESVPKVVFFLGGGLNSRIGAETIPAFAAKGYHVAYASRSLKDGRDQEGHLQLRLDLTDPGAIPGAFDRVKETFGTTPNVVIYNGHCRNVLSDTDPLSSIDPSRIEELNAEFSINITSALISAKCAVTGWNERPDSRLKTFLYSGNKLPVLPLPGVLTFGIGKSSVFYMIATLDAAYGTKGYRFYFTDERKENGVHAGADYDGKARAEVYAELAEKKEKRPWYYTFVKSRGYKYFEHTW
ncbi:MAG: hypothetical protein M1820_007081 [Bogoriella megaspora]|nr:MAG: hypothetical protein M1820_007081 [Bogoriella megaspora]